MEHFLKHALPFVGPSVLDALDFVGCPVKEKGSLLKAGWLKED